MKYTFAFNFKYATTITYNTPTSTVPERDVEIFNNAPPGMNDFLQNENQHFELFPKEGRYRKDEYTQIILIDSAPEKTQRYLQALIDAQESIDKREKALWYQEQHVRETFGW